MNRFKVAEGHEAEFESVWKNRDSSLDQLAGFVEFRLLKGKSFPDEGHTLYASHTFWKTEEDFVAWTKSENFRAAHKNAGANKTTYIGHPQFEGFTVVEGA
jgi:heme-degrading monooxygenase HmoA